MVQKRKKLTLVDKINGIHYSKMGSYEYLDYNDFIGEGIEKGAEIGSYSGMVAGLIAACIGGYEIGEAINSSSYLGDFVLKGISMAVLLFPGIRAGHVVGTFTGMVTGAIVNPVIQHTKNLYKRITKYDKNES